MPLPDSSRPGRDKIRRKRRDARPRARKYATTTLRQALDLPSAKLRLDPARGGTNSLVYILGIDGRPGAVVYLLTRYKNWCDMRDALLLGAAHDLPLPRLLHAEGSPLSSLRGRYQFLTTDFAEGSQVNHVPRTPALIELMAGTLARLHARDSDCWGKIRRPQTGPITGDWRGTIAKRMNGIRHHPQAPEPRLLDGIQAWFDHQLASLPEPRRFQLCHHHLAGDDMLVSPDASRITLIDCGDLQYSRAARDLACIRQGILLDDAKSWALFLDRYFAHFPRTVRPEWERELPLFEALYLLFKVRSGLGKKRHPHFLQRLLRVCGLASADA